MTYLTKKMITEIPHERAKSKAFTMKLADLPNMVDAVFGRLALQPRPLLDLSRGCRQIAANQKLNIRDEVGCALDRARKASSAACGRPLMAEKASPV